jgi:hypothetical protein
MLGAGVVTLLAGMALGHALMLAIGLGLAGLSGIGTPMRRQDACLDPQQVGGGADGAEPHEVQEIEVGRRVRREAPAVDDSGVADDVRMSVFETRRSQRVVVLADERRRHVLVYETGAEPGMPICALELEADEADQVASLLQSRSVAGEPADHAAVLAEARR